VTQFVHVTRTVSTTSSVSLEASMKRQRSARRLAIVATAVLGILPITLIATSAGAAASKVANAGTLTLGFEFSSVNFNPWESPNGDNASLQLSGAVYDSLTQLNGTKVAPDLATSWSFTTPTTMIIHLRSGVTFSDGTPLDAAAVKANFDYAKTATPAGQLATVFSGSTSTVMNATTLQLTLPTPNPDLPYDLATGGGFIVNPKALAKPSTLSTTPDGSGPYSLSSAASVPGQQYTFVKKSSYWNAKNYPYGTVVLKIFASPQAQDDALRSGQIQGASITATSALTDKSSTVRILQGPKNGLIGIWLTDRAGTINEAMGNVDVRQALNYAINRPAIIKAAGGGYASPGSLVVAPGEPGYTAKAANLYAYNPAKAKKLLSKAGYPHGFTLQLLSTPSGGTLVQATAGYLRAVGINVQISDHSTDFVTQALSGKWAALVFEWGTIPSVTSLSGLLSPTGIGNPNHSTNPAIDALLTNTETTTGATQSTAIKALVSAVNQQGWFLLAGYSELLYATSSGVTCGISSGCPLSTFRPAH
jgi:peptide/nickel transport system substrate-binding protein